MEDRALVRLPHYRQHVLPVQGLGSQDLEALERSARELASAAPGVREIPDAIVGAVRAQRGPHVPLIGGSGERTLPEELAADPADVVVHQPEAMARAVLLRDDPAQSPGVRAVWGAVVGRLAELRHQAKAGLYERRMRGELPALGLEAELRAMETARANDNDPEDEFGRGDPLGAPGIDSGRDEPAAWQPGNTRVGSTGA